MSLRGRFVLLLPYPLQLSFCSEYLHGNMHLQEEQLAQLRAQAEAARKVKEEEERKVSSELHPP